MKKLLPINISNNFYTECWTYFRFSIIEAYEQLKHWKYFNINYLYTDNMGNLFWGKSGEIYSPIYSYTEILNITGYLHSDISSNELVKFIKMQIDNGQYILLECNYPLLFEFDEDVYIHEVLIYGYDDEQSIFYIPDLHYGQWQVKKIPYANMEQAYKALDNQNKKVTGLFDFKRSYLMPITILQPKLVDYNINSNDFYHFYFYIKNLTEESITIKNNVSYTNGYFTYYEKLIFAGECIIAGSDSYYEKDYNYTTNIKKLLSFRLNLYEYISFADSKYLLNESKHLNETMKLKISDMLNECSNLSIKYMFSKKTACLEKIISILNECIILEKRFFNELNLSLEKYCRNNY